MRAGKQSSQKWDFCVNCNSAYHCHASEKRYAPFTAQFLRWKKENKNANFSSRKLKSLRFYMSVFWLKSASWIIGAAGRSRQILNSRSYLCGGWSKGEWRKKKIKMPIFLQDKAVRFYMSVFWLKSASWIIGAAGRSRHWNFEFKECSCAEDDQKANGAIFLRRKPC